MSKTKTKTPAATVTTPVGIKWRKPGLVNGPERAWPGDESVEECLERLGQLSALLSGVLDMAASADDHSLDEDAFPGLAEIAFEVRNRIQILDQWLPVEVAVWHPTQLPYGPQPKNAVVLAND